MPPAEILSVLRSFLREELSDRGGPLPGDTAPLLESGIVDSLGVLRLLAFIESRFRLRLPESDLHPGNFESLAAISGLVARRSRGVPKGDPVD